MSSINFACGLFISLVLVQILSFTSCGMLKTSSPNFVIDSQLATPHTHQINSALLKLIVKSYIENVLADSDIEDENVKQKLIDLR